MPPIVPKGGLLSLLEFDDLTTTKAGSKNKDQLLKAPATAIEDTGPTKLAIMDEFELDADETAQQTRRKNK